MVKNFGKETYGGFYVVKYKEIVYRSLSYLLRHCHINELVLINRITL